MNNIAIKVEKLSKAYKLYTNPLDRLKEAFHPFRKSYHELFYALKDIFFSVKKGQTLGIIGKNGSGKSTLLKIITGVLTATSGNVLVNGRVTALLELGAGFNPEFTGIENIYFNGTIMGYSNAEGDFLVFSDDDCYFMTDTLKNFKKVFSSDLNTGLVGGRDEQKDRGSSFEASLDCLYNSFLGGGRAGKNSKVKAGKYYPKLWNMAVRRNVALKVLLKNSGTGPELFDENLPVHQDVDLGKRIEKAGKKIVFAPDVLVKHRRDPSYLFFIKRDFNMARVSRAMGVHTFPHILLSIFAVFFIILIFFSFFLPVTRSVFLAYIALYMLPVLFVTIKGLLERKKGGLLFFIPLLTFSLHMARGLGYLFPWPLKRRYDCV